MQYHPEPGASEEERNKGYAQFSESINWYYDLWAKMEKLGILSQEIGPEKAWEKIYGKPAPLDPNDDVMQRTIKAFEDARKAKNEPKK